MHTETSENAHYVFVSEKHSDTNKFTLQIAPSLHIDGTVWKKTVSKTWMYLYESRMHK